MNADLQRSLHWSANYLGLPYAVGGRTRLGVDCWGLVRLVYMDLWQVDLPDLPGVSSQSVFDIAATITEHYAQWTELRAPVDGCAVAMGHREILHHVGIWVAADGGKVLHSSPGCRSSLDSLKALRLKGIKTIKFFEHNGIHS